MAHTIPAHFVHTRSTPFWDRNSVPRTLLTHHNTKKGVFGRLCVMRGAVKYYGFAAEHERSPEREIVINAGQFGISPPQYWHHIELLTPDTCFNIDFFADPAAQLEGQGIGQVVHLPPAR